MQRNEMSTSLEVTLDRIAEPDPQAAARARERLDSLTKPPGSLGVLEELVCRLAAIRGGVELKIPQKACILMAADHGVVVEGVSAFPAEVTPQMVLNFARGGAAMNILARHAGAELVLVDIGVAADLPPVPDLVRRKIAYGTANLAKGPAMSLEQALLAIEVGIEIAEECAQRKVGLLGTGEMGIGNTTPSAAITSVLCGLPVEDVVGRGTGIDNRRLKLKVHTIEQALEVNRPDPAKPLEVLAKVGGLEIAGLVGVMLGAAARRLPVIIDGFISGAAALVAARICPTASSYFLASHLSQEPGHRVQLESLGLKPMLQLDMRLGEGTGAALAMNIVDAAIKIYNEMASFADAGVSTAL